MKEERMTFVRNLDITIRMQKDGFKLPFIKKEKIAKDTFAFYFLRPQVGFNFLPGQYVSLRLDEAIEDSFRDFSIASSPYDTDHIRIVTKIRETTFKKRLFSLRENDLVHFSKPSGGFVFDYTDESPKIFLSGGVGIVPFFAMIEYALHKGLHHSITLISSFASKADIMYSKELTELVKQSASLHVVYTLTDKRTDWTGEKGRISPAIINKHSIDTSTSVFYLAGSPGFVVAMEDMLEKMGIRLQNIKMEQFTGY